MATTETNIRPTGLDDFVGQEQLRNHLRVILGAAKVRGEAPAHMLFAGPAGLGKSSLIGVIAAELGTKVHHVFAPNLKKGSDLATILLSISEGDLVAIDEIHALGLAIEEILYAAMEDFHIDIIVGDGAAAQSIRINLPRFTLVGATTLPGRLSAPLRDRFGFIGRLDYYQPEELTQVVLRSARLLGVDITEEAAALIGNRSRGTPRVANRLLERCRDYAQFTGAGYIGTFQASEALNLFGVDSLGLESTDTEILAALCGQFAGVPVGLVTLAATIGEDPGTIASVQEPFLLRLGLIVKGHGGRLATAAAYRHLGLRVPVSAL